MSKRKKPTATKEPVKVQIDHEDATLASVILMADEGIESGTTFEDHLDEVKADGEQGDQAEPKPQRRDDVKPHLRCPCCWNNYGGKAKKRKWQRQVSGPLVKRCYVCDQCDAEWVVDVRVEEQDGVEWVETKVSQVRQTA